MSAFVRAASAVASALGKSSQRRLNYRCVAINFAPRVGRSTKCGIIEMTGVPSSDFRCSIPSMRMSRFRRSGDVTSSSRPTGRRTKQKCAFPERRPESHGRSVLDHIGKQRLFVGTQREASATSGSHFGRRDSLVQPGRLGSRSKGRPRYPAAGRAGSKVALAGAKCRRVSRLPQAAQPGLARSNSWM